MGKLHCARKGLNRVATYNEQMQNLANQYMLETGKTEFTAKDIAGWAINGELWKPQRSALIKQCAEEFSRAMREEYIKDPQGRRVRLKHMAVTERDGEQIQLWADMRTATRDHMDMALRRIALKVSDPTLL